MHDPAPALLATAAYNEGTTLPAPLARGYVSPDCVAELVADGAEPVPDDTDTTDWNASDMLAAAGSGD